MLAVRSLCTKFHSTCLFSQTWITCGQIVRNSSTEIVENWKCPVGYDTGITCYNSLARASVPLILRNPNLATWYTCGPTVYDEMHIGHAYCYMQFDIIRRLLEKYFNIDVVLVMGVTDIDDKIISKSRELNMTIQHIVKHYEQDFFADLGRLQILPPSVITRVSDHIPHIIDFCTKILEKGFAYPTSEGTLYFDTKKFGQFGKLSNMGLEEEKESIDPLKRDPRDFALWKAVKPGEPWWEAPWGKGRPGWHIECSAMASHIFGSQLDIHSGGIDLIFPHHENEEKQSEVYHDTQQWANYWLHTGHLHLQNDTKMAKSLQNTISVKEFLKEHSPNDLRILCLRVPYKNGVEYSDETINDCKSINKKLKDFLTDTEAYVDGETSCGSIDEVHLMRCLAETKSAVRQYLATDFNTSQALNNIMQFIIEVNKSMQPSTKNQFKARSSGIIASCSSFVSRILNVLGVQYVNKKSLITSTESAMLTSVVDALVKFRSKVRLYALTTGSGSQPQYKIASPVSNGVSINNTTEEALPTPPSEPPHDKGDMIWTDKLSASERIQLQRKEREPLIKACDDIRNDLFIAGVQLKDRGKESSWSILEDKTLEGKKSSLSSHDAFDPSYTPRR